MESKLSLYVWISMGVPHNARLERGSGGGRGEACTEAGEGGTLSIDYPLYPVRHITLLQYLPLHPPSLLIIYPNRDTYNPQPKTLRFIPLCNISPCRVIKITGVFGKSGINSWNQFYCVHVLFRTYHEFGKIRGWSNNRKTRIAPMVFFQKF